MDAVTLEGTDAQSGDRSQLTARVIHESREVVLEVPSLTDHIGGALLSTNSFYELEFLRRLKAILRPGSLVIDVGANIGNHSLFFAIECACRVVAYEPVPSTAEILVRNIDLNFSYGLIEARRIALGAAAGSARLKRLPENNVGGAQLVADSSGSMPLSSLDQEHFDMPVSLIKIDAEGMDLEILRGGVDIIERDRPLLSFEAVTGTEREASREMMLSIGYAGLGVFNATPTYLYAPAASTEEIQRFLQTRAELEILQQEDVNFMKTDIARNLRYTKRLMNDHIAQGHQIFK
ncbi:FkbM family methyltransferase [Arthrobacter sp. TMN-50]